MWQSLYEECLVPLVLYIYQLFCILRNDIYATVATPAAVPTSIRLEGYSNVASCVKDSELSSVRGRFRSPCPIDATVFTILS